MAFTTTHYIVTLSRHASNLGMDAERLLADVGIPPALAEVDNEWIDNRQVIALLQRLWQVTNHETLGFDLEPARRGMWALCSEFMITADSLGEMYRRGARALEFLPPASLTLNLSTSQDVTSIRYGSYAGERDPNHFMAEFMGAVWHRFASWAIDEHIPLQAAWFDFPEPAHSWIYDELFQCDVDFDEQSCGFCFSTKYLSRPVVRSIEELSAWLRHSPADLLYLPGRETSITAQIKGNLVQSLSERSKFPSFERVCEHLHMSQQVVRRRLSDEGTSFQKIKDTVRCDRVCTLLRNPDLPIGDIADRVGFTEPAALSRAFKKWTGLTPAQYRDQHQDAS